MLNYLQKAWSDSTENVTMDDIRTAILETQKMDKEHGAFWVGTGEEEYILETSQNLEMMIIISGSEVQYNAKDWAEVEYLYKLLLAGDYDVLEAHVNNKGY